MNERNNARACFRGVVPITSLGSAMVFADHQHPEGLQMESRAPQARSLQPCRVDAEFCGSSSLANTRACVPRALPLRRRQLCRRRWQRRTRGAPIPITYTPDTNPYPITLSSNWRTASAAGDGRPPAAAAGAPVVGSATRIRGGTRAPPLSAEARPPTTLLAVLIRRRGPVSGKPCAA